MLCLCVAGPTEPGTPRAAEPTESDAKTEQENIQSNPTRLSSSTDSISLLLLSSSAGARQCQFSDARIKKKGDDGTNVDARPCSSSIPPPLVTSPGGAERSVVDKNINPVAELTPSPPPVTMINSYSDKICSYFSRLVGPMLIPVISVTIERRRRSSTCGCDKPSVCKCSGKLAGESVDRAPEKGVASKKPPANGPQGGGNHLLVQVGDGGGGGGIPPVKVGADYGSPPAKVVSGSGKPLAKAVSGSGKPPEKGGNPLEKGGNPLVKGGGGGVARPRPLRHLAVLLAVFSCLCAAVAADTSQPEEKSKFNFKGRVGENY